MSTRESWTTGGDATRPYTPLEVSPFIQIRDGSPLRMVSLCYGPAGGTVIRILKLHDQFPAANTSRNSEQYSSIYWTEPIPDLLDSLTNSTTRLYSGVFAFNVLPRTATTSANPRRSDGSSYDSSDELLLSPIPSNVNSGATAISSRGSPAHKTV